MVKQLNQTEKKKNMLKEFKENVANVKSEFVEKRELYIKLRAEREALLKLGEQLQNEVLKENNFVYDKTCKRFAEQKGEKILSYKDDYNMSDEDFTKYLKLVHEKRNKHIKISGGYEYSIDSDIQDSFKAAEYEFKKLIIEIQPKEFKETIRNLFNSYKSDLINECIELNLKLKFE